MHIIERKKGRENMHITITGNLGSGKSTICKILEKKYGFEIYSTGKVQRKLAAELSLTTLEMNQLMCSDEKYDHMIDDATARISRENRDKNIIFDSRLAWNFVEQSFKVFLSIGLEEAAKRVYADNRGEVETYQSFEDCKEKLRLRAKTETARYKELYQLDYFKYSNYNLVLDSTFLEPEQLADVIYAEAMIKQEENRGTRLLISPKRLGIFDAVASKQPSCFYKPKYVVIGQQEDFFVKEGIEVVQEAAKEGIPFVQALWKD